MMNHGCTVLEPAPLYVYSGACPAQQKEADRKRETKPTETLFIVNFDLGRVRERDIEKFFNPYGRIKRVEIKRNYAFVQVRMGTVFRCSVSNACGAVRSQ